MNAKPLTLAASLAGALMLTGCATPGSISKEAVDANLAFERQNNDLLLLNILRASKDLPMHFSRINTVRMTAGIAGLNARATLPSVGALPVVGSGAQIGPLTQRAGFEIGGAGPGLPSLDVTPLDGQEFMQGVMAPVSTATIPILSEVGWPTELLMYLLIDSLSITTAETSRLLQNDPRHPTYREFRAYVAALQPGDCVLVPKNGTPTRYTPDYSTAIPAQPTLEGAVAARAGGLVPFTSSGGYYFGTPTRQMALNCSAPVDDKGKRQQVAPSLQALRQNFTLQARSESAQPKPEALAAGVEDVSATLRSPYGVLAYLGALHQKGEKHLFHVTAGPTDSLTVIAKADLLGESFHIPAQAAGSTTAKSLAIAWQLLQLQSKGSTAPVTGTVRVAQ
jgi:hypothetical protein